ncbi:hypothetical protein GGX14DRAFT_571355 [Mycena pura]|uniref:Uncharacterized protein n=1 Tax=Mycena pura TaxID=153505 RepID=A0AAD6V3Q6_9AGAR|nr:hypothetical protein GGX14DRAFT_571355 [Mycena pura]
MVGTTLPPEEWLDPEAIKLWEAGKTDVALSKIIVEMIAANPEFVGKNHSMSESGIKRARKRLGLQGPCQARASGAHDSIPDLIRGLRPAYPTMGARDMVVLLRQEHHIKISE